MKKLLLFFIGFFMALSAHASFPATQQTEQFRLTSNVVWDWARQDAADRFIAYREVSNTSGSENYSINSITTTGGSGWGSLFYKITNASTGATLIANQEAWFSQQVASGYSCPANSTLAGSTCTCSAGYDESGSTCVAHVNQCTTRAPGITNHTVGYVRTLLPDDYDAVGPTNPIPTGSICDAGCTVTLGEAVAAWRSETPTSQGLHRISIDFQSTPTGSECSTPTPSVDKNLPPPTCPGYVGEVNGKTGCYGTAQSPVTTSKAPSGGVPTKPGNPAAGQKPLSGDGSGSTGTTRTPPTGDGSAKGGPASSAGNSGGLSGGSGTKDVEAGKEQLACGAPGQPKCGIDETGTPDGKGVLPTTDFNNKLKEREDALAGVVSASGKDASWGVMPQWTQGGTCSPWQIATMPPVLGSFVVTVDLCPHKAFTDGIANFIWLGLAFFGITGMIFSTMTSKGS